MGPATKCRNRESAVTACGASTAASALRSGNQWRQPAASPTATASVRRTVKGSRRFFFCSCADRTAASSAPPLLVGTVTPRPTLDYPTPTRQVGSCEDKPPQAHKSCPRAQCHSAKRRTRFAASLLRRRLRPPQRYFVVRDAFVRRSGTTSPAKAEGGSSFECEGRKHESHCGSSAGPNQAAHCAYWPKL